MKYKVMHGDCIELMRSVCGDDSIDAIVTDPPAGIAFMGKDWDKDKGGRRQWIAWMTGVARECLRVLKPGGHALVWALPRTSHWTGTAWEDAGYEVRDCVYHAFGTGFPKSANISKHLDKAAGVAREVVGSKLGQPGYSLAEGKGRNTLNSAVDGSLNNAAAECEVTAPATDDAKQWDGWGTALKPAMECWWLFRKPLSEKTVAANVLEHGTGAINIDKCRVGDGRVQSSAGKGAPFGAGKYPKGEGRQYQNNGRWPANLILSHHEECERVGTKKVKACGIGSKKGKTAADKDGQSGPAYGAESRSSGTEMICYADADGMETIEEWRCHPDCPVRILDEQSGVTASGAMKREVGAYEGDSNTGFLRGNSGPSNQHGGKGGASRYFYQAKPAKKERNFGMPEGTKNVHPTVKSVSLMRYLIRLVTPPGGTVLDAFAGSGSTVLAAMLEDVNCLACEKEAESYETAKQRCDYAFEHLEELRDIVDKPKKTPKKAKKQKKVEKS